MSNQYGYIPMANAELLQESYSISTPATWQFEKNGIQYGGMEEVIFTEAQRSEITSLGGQWFDSAINFLNWLNS